MNNHTHDLREDTMPVYTCPMHPEVVKNAPGKCPGCGMELIPQSKPSDPHAGHDFSKVSHTDHESAMTNPQMAKQMEADMRHRFFISLILSIPIFLYSPVGINRISEIKNRWRISAS